MKCLPTLFLILLLCSEFAFGQKYVSAFTILKKNFPSVQWNSKSRIKGDFDYDRVTDYALRGKKGTKFVVGIVKGSITNKSKYWTLEFGEDAGDQGGLCSVKSAVITVNDIDKDYVQFASDYLEPAYAERLKNLPKNSNGIIISDGLCDSFHIFGIRKTSSSPGGEFKFSN